MVENNERGNLIIQGVFFCLLHFAAGVAVGAEVGALVTQARVRSMSVKAYVLAAMMS